MTYAVISDDFWGVIGANAKEEVARMFAVDYWLASDQYEDPWELKVWSSDEWAHILPENCKWVIPINDDENIYIVECDDEDPR